MLSVDVFRTVCENYLPELHLDDYHVKVVLRRVDRDLAMDCVDVLLWVSGDLGEIDALVKIPFKEFFFSPGMVDAARLLDEYIVDLVKKVAPKVATRVSVVTGGPVDDAETGTLWLSFIDRQEG